MSAPSGSSDLSGRVDGSVRRARRRPGENRERLLEAGITVFGSHGYQGGSTAAIAALAGVPQPHVYASFHTKQELFLACVQRVNDDLARAASARSRSPAVAGSPVGDSAAALFLLQCIAASQEQVLQPELSELLQQLTDALGTEAILTLVRESAQAVLATRPNA